MPEKLTPYQKKNLYNLHKSGRYEVKELAEMFKISISFAGKIIEKEWEKDIRSKYAFEAKPRKSENLNPDWEMIIKENEECLKPSRSPREIIEYFNTPEPIPSFSERLNAALYQNYQLKR